MRETRTAQMNLFDFYSEHKRSDQLRSLSNLIDAHPDLLELVKCDLLNKNAKATGCKGLSVESIFRCMVLKQITQESYEQLAFLLTDSHSYRTFARLDKNCFPSKSALCDTIRRLQPETLEAVARQLLKHIWLAGDLDTDMMRVDSTVVKSNIAPPTDSRLLDDGIRVLSRLFSKSRDRTGIKLRLTDYRQASRTLAAAIFYGKKAEKDALYPDLLQLARNVIRQSERAIEHVAANSTYPIADVWINTVTHYRDLLKRVIRQCERRVLYHEKVPASEKIVSLFEPHTDIIVKGERDVVYGHKINLSSNKHGFITVMMLEKGNPKDSERFIPLLEQHQALYGEVPATSIADGCFASMHNVNAANAMGVTKVAFHKKNGVTLSAMGIKDKTLKKLRAFRAGIEGNISEFKRAFGASKATWKGESGFAAFVWASVISYNLMHWVRLDSG